jgi:molybdate transport system ATP-binding protein
MSLQLRLNIPRDAFTVNVSLTVMPGEVVSVFGPSGCGKTSLLRAIAGLEPAAKGFVSAGDTLWQDERIFLAPHKRDIGFVFQNAGLFPHLNVMDNLRFGQKRQPAHKQKVSLEQAIDLLALAPLLKRPVDKLSGGERQRVAIARALATSPSVLLFDEPLSGIDIQHKQEIMRYIQALHRQLTIPMLYVSHALDEVARLSDRMVLLDKGQQLAQGETVALLSQLDHPLAEYEDAAAVLDTRVQSVDNQYGLTYLQFKGGQISVSHSKLSPGEAIRLRVMARDVSLTLQKQSGSSILNIFPVTVEALRHEGQSQCLVRLDANGDKLLSRITMKSADELALKPGMAIFAQVKSVSLLT